MDREFDGKKLRDNLLDKFRHFKNDFKSIPDAAEYCYDNPDVWKSITLGSGLHANFNSFWDWVKHPTPIGLGSTKDIVLAICDQDRPSVAKKLRGHNEKLGVKGAHRVNHPMNDTKYSKTYVIQRLRKEDKDDLADQVSSGEISTKEVSEIMGWRARRMTVPLIKEKVVGWILKYFNEDDIEYIKNNL